jgi:hypothetical protein
MGIYYVCVFIQHSFTVLYSTNFDCKMILKVICVLLFVASLGVNVGNNHGSSNAGTCT